MTDLRSLSSKALDDVENVLNSLDPNSADQLAGEIMNARRIVCCDVGRSGLTMRALCLRLLHLGFDAHVVSDATTPPIGAGDLFIASSGWGTGATTGALLNVAKRDGARTLLITAQPRTDATKQIDVAITLSIPEIDVTPPDCLPNDSLFEIVALLLVDLVAIILRGKTNQTTEDMRQRQTNLE